LGPDLLVLDGGPCVVGLESTILSLWTDPPQLLRPGAITRETLEHALGEALAFEHRVVPADQAASSPGQHLRHYSPHTPCVIRGTLDPALYPKRTSLIAFGEVDFARCEFDYIDVRVLSRTGDLTEVSAKLFAALRSLDGLQLDLIVIDQCPPHGIGSALMDRIRRACTSRAT
jgi:L-threonylcarbamoyladenylate synthase